MPKIVIPLTLAQVKAARAKDKMYKLSDGGGLALWVLPSGKKSWRLQYRRPTDGKADTLTLGLFPKFGMTWLRNIDLKIAWRFGMTAGLDRAAKMAAEKRRVMQKPYCLRLS